MYLLETLPLADEESVVTVLATFIPTDDNEDALEEVTDFIRCFKFVTADDDTATDARYASASNPGASFRSYLPSAPIR